MFPVSLPLPTPPSVSWSSKRVVILLDSRTLRRDNWSSSAGSQALILVV